MITYDPLWNTMKAKGISQYRLIKEYGISTGQLSACGQISMSLRIRWIGSVKYSTASFRMLPSIKKTSKSPHSPENIF